VSKSNAITAAFIILHTY